MNNIQTTSQSKLAEKLTKVSKKIAKVKRNEKGQLLPGSILNPEGLQEGTKQFKTIMDETVADIAKQNNLSKGEVWKVLIKRGYSEAKDGNYSFYKDILDRYFGKATENVEMKHDMSNNFINLIKNATDTNATGNNKLSEEDN